MNRPHLSPSQLETFCRCPEQWRRRYIEKDRMPPGIAALRGVAAHAAAETNFRQKIDSRTDLPVADLIESGVSAYEARAAGEGVAFTDDEIARGARVVLGEGKDAAVEAIRFFAERQAPDYQPLVVEEPVRLELDDQPFDLFGVVDLIAEPYLAEQARQFAAKNPELAARALGPGVDPLAIRPRIVVDFKTATKSKRQADADSSVQLSFYAIAAELLFDAPPDEVRLDVAVLGKTSVERQILTSRRGEADFAALERRVVAVSRAIQSGVFPPASPGAWWCDPRYCGYYSTCPYVRSKT